VRLFFFACRPVDPQCAPHHPFRWVSREHLARLHFPAANRQLVKMLAEGPG
jgi:hypothetical protein